MSQVVVPDASAVVAVLLDAAEDGDWVANTVRGATLLAPALLSFETANIIRRHELAGLVTAEQAAQAHADLLALPIEYWPYEATAQRAWELRRNVTVYDASYVALAELQGVPLVTLDRRIRRAPGVGCPVVSPPD